MSCKSIFIASNSISTSTRTRSSRLPIPSSSNFKNISYGCFNSSPEDVFPTLYYHSSGTKKYYVGNVKRRSLAIHCACSLVLPLLPFPLEQVLIPSERKSLHLYEARYLKLLDESVSKKKKLFVHFVLDPIVMGSVTSEPSFAARYGCLVEIEKVERLDVGALVSIRGIGRVTIAKFEQAEPYLNGVVLPLQDNVPEDLSNISSKVSKLKEALYSLNSLEIKLKASKEAILQTQTANSLSWSEKELSIDCDESFIPSVAERLSFAALQPISGTSQLEMLELLKEKLNAMDIKETIERLDVSLNLVNNNISLLAAKLAIQSLELQ